MLSAQSLDSCSPSLSSASGPDSALGHVLAGSGREDSDLISDGISSFCLGFPLGLRTEAHAVFPLILSLISVPTRNN